MNMELSANLFRSYVIKQARVADFSFSVLLDLSIERSILFISFVCVYSYLMFWWTKDREHENLPKPND